MAKKKSEPAQEVTVDDFDSPVATQDYYDDYQNVVAILKRAYAEGGHARDCKHHTYLDVAKCNCWVSVAGKYLA